MNPNALVLDRTLKSDINRHSGKRWSNPIQAQLWYRWEPVYSVPLRIVDGVADDIKFRPKEMIRFDRLVFLHSSRVRDGHGGLFIHWFPEVQVAKKGELVHLALGHLELRDKFGHNILG